MVKLYCTFSLKFRSLYVKDLGIDIIFSTPFRLYQNKIKDIDRVMRRVIKYGHISRVERRSIYAYNDKPRRWIEVEHNRVLEFLDYFGYGVES